MGICPSSPESAIFKKTTIQPRLTKEQIKKPLHSTYEPGSQKIVKRKLSDGAMSILQKYQVIELVGTGSFGKVLLAKSKLIPGLKVAIKSIPKKKLKNKLHVVKKQIDILKHLDHPNIVKYYEYYETSKNFFIITQYCDGGQLFQKIAEKGEQSFSQHQAGRIIERILLGINHCHANHIAHRDLKPENILFSTQRPDSELKIIDFGLSKSYLDQVIFNNKNNDEDQVNGNMNQEKQRQNSYNHDLVFQSVVGTPYYVAPEVLKSSLKYGAKCDLWSIGVILYILLSGYIPFTGKNATEVFIKIRFGKYSMSQNEWSFVSEQAKDLVRSLLDINPISRISASDSLKGNVNTLNLSANHQGEQKKHQGQSLNPSILQTMRNFASASLLKKQAAKILVKLLNDQDIKHLKLRFHSMDKDSTGHITIDQLQQAMQQTGLNITKKQVIQMLENINLKKNGSINYSQFIASTMKIKKHLNHAKMKALFRHFDIDRSGTISKQNLKEVFIRAGKNVSQQQIDEIVMQHDLNGDGQICFHEFKQMLTGVNLQDIKQIPEYI